jgi:hypothetical protein
LATQLYDTVEIELQDGRKAVLKPLPIKHLRDFMAVVAKLDKVETEQDAIDIFIEASAIALRKSLPDLANNKEALEEALDVPTIWKIMEICGGIKLGDPNLVAAAAKMSGTN